MLSLLLLILTIALSLLVIRVGTIAFELTGLDEEQSYFQAVSAFTGTGFTTREAELVVSQPSRRKIARVLILLGSAGVITTVGTLAGTLVSTPGIASSFSDSHSLSWIPLNETQLTLLGLITIIFAVIQLIKTPGVSRLIKEIISVTLLKSQMVSPVLFRELVSNSEGFGAIQVEVCDKNPLRNTLLKDANLEQKGITVISLERLGESTNYPPPTAEIKQGDSLILVGPVSEIRSYCCAANKDQPKTSSPKQPKEIDEMLKIGSLAPDFVLKDQYGNNFSLSERRGKKSVVIIFYPKDKSHFCSLTLREYSEQLPEISSDDIEIVGINPESQQSHMEFCEVLQSKLPVLSDPDKKVCASYKALMVMGLLVNRCIYVVDKHGKICFAKRGRPPIHEVLRAARVS